MGVFVGCITSMLMVSDPIYVSKAYEDANENLVGTLPAGDADALQPLALESFTKGLKVDTCQATPSLGASVPAATA